MILPAILTLVVISLMLVGFWAVAAVAVPETAVAGQHPRCWDFRRNPPKRRSNYFELGKTRTDGVETCRAVLEDIRQTLLNVS
jgi:hypothetical protein